LDKALEWMARHWRGLVLAAWLIACVYLVVDRWNAIQLFALGDTDDNMRMSQVRAWLAGQGWFDLRQHKLDAAFGGANIHWSRLVDLPLAGLIQLARLFTNGARAEQFAVAAAPLLPLLPMLAALTVIARRLIAPAAFVPVLIALFFAGSTRGMFVPLRIDHHGWQLALLAVAVCGLVDPKRRRGGAITGVATALSLTIGLEMLIYLAIAAAAQVLMWVDERDQRLRLASYAVTLAGGMAAGFALFASEANRAAVCDALSPVWLSDALVGGALLLVLAWRSPADWRVRLALAAGAGLIVAGFHALAWPHCLSRLEGVSPEVERLWLSNVREAKPIYQHGWRIATIMLAIPAVGAAGWAMLAWRARVDRDLFRRTLAAATIAIMSFAWLFWQTRAGPAAQMLGVPGSAALAWLLLPRAWRSANSVVVVLGTSAALLVGVGAAIPALMTFVPDEAKSAQGKVINRANNLCPSMWAMRPVAKLPKGTIFTFVDLAPRVITITHHNSVAGPYHRNGPAIADSMKAFLGNADQARLLIARHQADYLMICPNMSQATVFMSRAPKGFYAQLARGQVPGWLKPIALPKDSPLRIWRVMK
jgi:hypothetical protein